MNQLFRSIVPLLLLVLALPPAVVAANFKLYLKDGDYHVVREYHVEGDRVRFYSVERRDWEEIPLELIDLNRTKTELKEKAEEERKSAQLIDEEEKAERAAAAEVARVPQGAGVYYVAGEEVKPVPVAESQLNNNKRRSILAAISPIPMITGKATLEIDGDASKFVVYEELPEFYIRLSRPERFGIVKLSPGAKNARIVEKITIIPVSKEMVEEREEVEIFRRQVGDELYKIWPMKPLEPGEYAAVQFTEGKVNMQVWDFAVKTKQ